MMRYTHLKHLFVHHIPARIEPGVLYISIEYATAIHKCCCGCGEEVVTPITPTDWKMTFDGETISLWPSIGNWNIACRSHYVIKESRVIKAATWPHRQIGLAHQMDKAMKAKFYGERGSAETDQNVPMLPPPSNVGSDSWSWVKKWIGRRKS